VSHWDWLAIFALCVLVYFLADVSWKLQRIIRLLESANEELRYTNREAHRRDLLGDDYD
jgi:hypothetical protein